MFTNRKIRKSLESAIEDLKRQGIDPPQVKSEKEFDINQYHVNQILSDSRKNKLMRLEIGDSWKGGYIEKFNPSKTKVQIRVNIDGAPDQLKWVDLK